MDDKTERARPIHAYGGIEHYKPKIYPDCLLCQLATLRGMLEQAEQEKAALAAELAAAENNYVRAEAALQDFGARLVATESSYVKAAAALRDARAAAAVIKRERDETARGFDHWMTVATELETQLVAAQKRNGELEAALTEIVMLAGPGGTNPPDETISDVARAALAAAGTGERDIPREAAAFTRTLTDDSENEPPDIRVPGDDFGS